VLRAWWFVRRPSTRGVKCLVRHGDQVVFVRHSYGTRHEWELPGGGLRRHEEAAAGARREMREELGVDIVAWRELGSVWSSDHHKRTLLHLVEGAAPEAELSPLDAELEEARWARPEAPPRPLSEEAEALLGMATGPGPSRSAR
jgi:8-oxo-dGTP pyrophosphatase MutT (NUDIX family)